MRVKGWLCAALGACILWSGGSEALAADPLVIESWRAEDQVIWDEHLLPAFHAKHPGIRVEFRPEDALAYDGRVNDRLSNRRAGDLIACRPFDESNKIYQRGYFEPLPTDVLQSYDSDARMPWTSDDGQHTYCLPLAYVTHGYLYNTDIFKSLGLTVPRTHAELNAVLKRLLDDRRYVPLALGTADRWETTQVMFTGMGPSFWAGEAGRKALLDGQAEFTDEAFVASWRWLAGLAPYLPPGHRDMSNADARLLFATGNAAIYPTGSWDLPFLRETQFPGNRRVVPFAAFAPTTINAQDDCQVSAHPDMAMGINRYSPRKEQALVFLRWLASAEFIQLLNTVMAGFYPLAPHAVPITDPVASDMQSWGQRCKSTIRLNAHWMNRYFPPLEEELWNVNVNVINGTMSPSEAASRIQNVHQSNRERLVPAR